MKKNEFIGIDVSKKTLDVWMYFEKKYKQLPNTVKGFEQLLHWVKMNTVDKYQSVSFCFEHTGYYSLPLSAFLTEHEITYYQVSGLMVKRSLGLVRGKNDKVDARHLAEYIYRNVDRLVPYRLPSKALQSLKKLLNLREKLVKQRSGFKSDIKEIIAMGLTTLHKEVLDQSRDMIDILNQKIIFIEKKVQTIIKEEPELNQTYSNIASIKGVGLVLGASMIAYTTNFTSFDQWRKFACYAGTAPFEHRSGTSYLGKTRVSSLGNRRIKSILWLAAISSIQYNAEIKAYYHRKLLEGKPKMTIINGVCNKLISRIFAVALRKQPYVDIYKFAA